MQSSCIKCTSLRLSRPVHPTLRTPANEHSAILPPENLEPVLDLSHFLEQVVEPVALIETDGRTIGLPMKTYRMLIDIVHAMS